ncbi:hypothetical protein OG458_41560 (plasmid) [Streptomyces sp. NBC_01281]|uniref:hypothetical protein n=1 Tax=Streptomyces sp. NBC_01281 TaxID=2903811 RepID=UPI002E153FB5|nr:hypothetical protein OG458_41560 [Streptomyces sp. NBC_01281]
MNKLTYPRTADAIATRARMILAAYRAVPAREAAYHLGCSLQDMWGYGYFALHNGETAPWVQTRQRLFDALQLFNPASSAPGDSTPTAAAAEAIHCFEQTAGIVPGTAPEPLYTRAEAEQAAHAAFDRISQYIKLDHRHDRQFVTQAFLAFLDNPDSPYPYKSHDPDDEEDDGAQEGGSGQGGDSDVQAEPELSPEETGERENALLYWLGPRPGTTPDGS